MKFVFIKCGDKFGRGGITPNFSKTPKIWNLRDFKLHLSQDKNKFKNVYKNCSIYLIEVDLEKNQSNLKKFSYDEFINLFIN
jgi:hypothetical protein